MAEALIRIFLAVVKLLPVTNARVACVAFAGVVSVPIWLSAKLTPIDPAPATIPAEIATAAETTLEVDVAVLTALTVMSPVILLFVIRALVTSASVIRLISLSDVAPAPAKAAPPRIPAPTATEAAVEFASIVLLLVDSTVIAPADTPLAITMAALVRALSSILAVELAETSFLPIATPMEMARPPQRPTAAAIEAPTANALIVLLSAESTSKLPTLKCGAPRSVMAAVRMTSALVVE